MSLISASLDGLTKRNPRSGRVAMDDKVFCFPQPIKSIEAAISALMGCVFIFSLNLKQTVGSTFSDFRGFNPMSLEKQSFAHSDQFLPSCFLRKFRRSCSIRSL